MGNRNVDRAFALYGATLRKKPMALLLLVYMARHSVDTDNRPFSSIGAVRIAKDVFGRPEGTSADLRAVERVMADLRAVGAITTERRASPTRSNGYRTAKYALHLDRPASIEHPSQNVGSATGHTRQSVVEPPVTPWGSTPVTERRAEVDLGVPLENGVAGRAPLTDARPRRTPPPPGTAETAAAALQALAAKGIRSRRLKSVEGGKAADSPDDPARQLPLLGLVPGESESVGVQQEREAL